MEVETWPPKVFHSLEREGERKRVKGNERW